MDPLGFCKNHYPDCSPSWSKEQGSLRDRGLINGIAGLAWPWQQSPCNTAIPGVDPPNCCQRFFDLVTAHLTGLGHAESLCANAVLCQQHELWRRQWEVPLPSPSPHPCPHSLSSGFSLNKNNLTGFSIYIIPGKNSGSASLLNGCLLFYYGDGLWLVSEIVNNAFSDKYGIASNSRTFY